MAGEEVKTEEGKETEYVGNKEMQTGDMSFEGGGGELRQERRTDTTLCNLVLTSTKQGMMRMQQTAKKVFMVLVFFQDWMKLR